MFLPKPIFTANLNDEHKNEMALSNVVFAVRPSFG